MHGQQMNWGGKSRREKVPVGPTNLPGALPRTFATPIFSCDKAHTAVAGSQSSAQSRAGAVIWTLLLISVAPIQYNRLSPLAGSPREARKPANQSPRPSAPHGGARC